MILGFKYAQYGIFITLGVTSMVGLVMFAVLQHPDLSGFVKGTVVLLLSLMYLVGALAAAARLGSILEPLFLFNCPPVKIMAHETGVEATKATLYLLESGLTPVGSPFVKPKAREV